MALEPYALTTVARVRKHSRSNRTDDTEQLEILINGFSDAIREVTGREFLPKDPALDSDAPVARYFRYDGGRSLSLDPYEARSITAVTLFPDMPTVSERILVNPAAEVIGDYRLGPRGGTRELKTYLYIELPRVPLYGYDDVTWGTVTRPATSFALEVKVEGRWGAGKVPGAVETACLMAVDEEVNAPSFSRQTPEGGQEETITAEVFKGALPPQALGMLASYVRPSRGGRRFPN